jgi:hypothetical protein
VRSLFVSISNNFAWVLKTPLDPTYILEQEPVIPSCMPSIRMPMRFGDPEGDDVFIPLRMGHLRYSPPPGSRYTVPPPMGYSTQFAEPESPLIVPIRPRSRMPSSTPIIEVHGPEHTGPSRSRRSASPESIVQHATEAPPGYCRTST